MMCLDGNYAAIFDEVRRTTGQSGKNEKEEIMEKEQLKKILAGIGLAGLLTAAGATFPGSASAA